MPAITEVSADRVNADNRDALARYDRLYAATVVRVTAYARSRLPADQAADVVADTFLVAWRRLDEVPERALPWLLVVARNTVSQRQRGETRNRALTVELERLHHLNATVEPDLAAEVVERITVLAALDALAPVDREAIELTAWDGLAPRDAAVVAGCSAATFRVRLHRARARLTRALADDAENQRAPTPPAAGRVISASVVGPSCVHRTGGLP